MRVKLPAIAAFCAAIVVTAAACSSDEPQTELEVAEVEIQVTSSDSLVKTRFEEVPAI